MWRYLPCTPHGVLQVLPAVGSRVICLGGIPPMILAGLPNTGAIRMSRRSVIAMLLALFLFEDRDLA